MNHRGTRSHATGGYENSALSSDQVLDFVGTSDLAGEPGFEPRQTESESVVLPLHHSPTAETDLGRISVVTGPILQIEPVPGTI
jgi:hypothetical protein